MSGSIRGILGGEGLGHDAPAMGAPDKMEVIGAPSAAWGETPVAFVTLRSPVDAEALRTWANTRLGKTQRLAHLRVVAALPRSAIGKVLKRELRNAYDGAAP